MNSGFYAPSSIISQTIMYLIKVYDKSDHCFPGQNGMWVNFRSTSLKMMVKSGLEELFLKFHYGLAIYD